MITMRAGCLVLRMTLGIVDVFCRVFASIDCADDIGHIVYGNKTALM